MKALNNQLINNTTMKTYNKLKWLTLAGIGLFIASCTDKWEDHYVTQPATMDGTQTIAEYIGSQPDLSVFAQMLTISGYDSILSAPQTFTVWAPANAALSNINLQDGELVRNMVMNHISRFSYPTSNLSSKVIYMLDKKFITFNRGDGNFKFGGIDLISEKSNIALANGIVHHINGFVPYKDNLWEYILKANELDSLRNFLNSQSEYIFDSKNSVEIGTNEFGQAIYDSVITFSNPILDKIGYLHLEDSVYSAILPDNKAWKDAYDKVKSNYKTLAVDGGAPRQRYLSQLALVRNLVFRNEIVAVEGLDSLVSTTGSKFMNPAYLFTNATPVSLSNGIGFVTDSLRYKAAESWQQPIVLEAENSNYGRSYQYANLFVRSSLGSSLDGQVSESKYLLVEPTTVSNNTMSSVTFPIPNTLSGKYNVYCVLVPGTIVEGAAPKANKVKFYLSYLNNSGTQINDAPIDAANKISTPGRVAAIFTSEDATISKMFVTQVEFPYCNILEENDPSSMITIKLKVENATRITETVRFNRSLRIDYILLEPAQ
jgi:hypothetical protein